MADYKVDLVGSFLYFSGGINETSAHDFIIKLHELEDSIQDKEDKVVNLVLYSYGSSITAGLRMYESLKMFNGVINCCVSGFIGSSASFIMCSCNEVTATPLTTFLIHQMSSYFDDKFDNNRAVMGWYDTLHSYYLDIYSKKTKGKITADMFIGRDISNCTAGSRFRVGR